MSKIITYIVHVFCVLGCLYQVSQILPIYFNYSIASELSIEIPSRLKAHDLSYCIRWVDVFDFSSYLKDKQLSFRYDEDVDVKDKIAFVSSSATVEEIMNYTTPVEELIEECMIRLPNDFGYSFVNRSGCNKMFTVTKYFLQEFVCYMVHLKQYENETYLRRPVKFALAFQNSIFILNLVPFKVHGSKMLKYIAHTAGFPHVSAGLCSPIPNVYDPQTHSYQFNSVQVTYTHLSITKLPPPYPTMCGMLDKTRFASRYDCVSKCINNLTLNQFNKLPFSVISIKNLNHKHMNKKDVKSSSEHLRNIELKCDMTCFSDNCDEEFTITRVTTRNNGRPLFGITSEIPIEPILRLSYHPRLSLTELVIYVLGTIGSWLGVSVLSISVAMIKIKSKMKRSQIRKRPNRNDNNANIARSLENLRNENLVVNKRIDDMNISLRRLLNITTA